MANMFTTRTTVQTQTKVLEKTFYNSVASIAPLYSKFINVIKTDSKRSFATFLPYAGLGTTEVKLEGQAPIYDQPYELIPYTALFFTYALAVKATEESEMEDPENMLGKVPGQLAKASRDTKDLVIWNLLNQAFNSAVLYNDGQPLCSTIHPLGPIATPTGLVSSIGSTFSNSLGATALTPESLRQAEILFETLLTDRGMPDRRTPKYLMCAPQIAKIAQEIIGSDKAPFSNENKINTEQGIVEVVANRFLTNPLAWFLMAGTGEPFSGGDAHQLFAAFKWENRYKVWTDGETDNYNQKVSDRYTYGAGGWRGIVGSQGA